MTTYHIAQVNIARALYETDDPRMAGFMDNLDRINALAEATPGFVWRLQTADGDATALRVFDDEWMLINMSVWEDADALHKYTYSGEHVEIFRQRRDWFSKLTQHYLALWWVPAGTIPTPDEARSKLEHLDTHGPTPLAFTFKQRFTVEEMLAASTHPES